MGILEKAQKQLEGMGVPTEVQNENLYVYVGDLLLELSEHEVSFRGKLYDEQLN